MSPRADAPGAPREAVGQCRSRPGPALYRRCCGVYAVRPRGGQSSFPDLHLQGFVPYEDYFAVRTILPFNALTKNYVPGFAPALIKRS